MPVRDDFQPGEFCWVDLTAHDLEAACVWYGELFGWSHAKMETPGGGPPYAFFKRGEAVIGGIGQMSDEMKSQGVPPTWNSYVATEDCAATEARVKELGGKVAVPTMEVPGFGKLAVFMDHEGASLSAWQALGGDTKMLVNEPTGFCWNELMCRDTAKARKYYGELFGWKYNPMPMDGVDYRVIQNDGKDVGGMMSMADAGQPEGVPAHWLTYFAVADCKDATARIEKKGGVVRVPPMHIEVGEFSMVCDPQGATFCTITLDEWPG